MALASLVGAHFPLQSLRGLYLPFSLSGAALSSPVSQVSALAVLSLRSRTCLSPGGRTCLARKQRVGVVQTRKRRRAFVCGKPIYPYHVEFNVTLFLDVVNEWRAELRLSEDDVVELA